MAAGRHIALALAFPLMALGGCAGVGDFTPYAMDNKDAAAFAQDLNDCRQVASDYGRHFSPSQIAQATATGALNNLPSIAIAPAATALAGVGSGSGEAISELGLTDAAVRKIVAWCMRTKGEHSGLYSIVDPNL